jgi:ABC-2 type transport system permease protein
MNQLKVVIIFELKRIIGKKSFWLALLAMPILIVGGFGLSSYSTNHADKSNIGFLNNSNFEYFDPQNLINKSIASELHGYRTTNADLAISQVKAGKLNAFFELPSDISTQPVLIYGQERSPFSDGNYATIITSILRNSAKLNLSTVQYKLISGEFQNQLTTYKLGKKFPSFHDGLPSIAFILLLIFMTQLMVPYSTQALIDEKENRVVEMLLVNAKAKTLFFGKAIALFLVSVIQSLVYIVPLIFEYGTIARGIAIPPLANLLHNPTRYILAYLMLLIGIFFITASGLAIGQKFNSAKEAAPYLSVFVLVTFLPLYVFSLLLNSPTSGLAYFFRFFPFTSAFTNILLGGFNLISISDISLCLFSELLFALVVLYFSAAHFQANPLGTVANTRFSQLGEKLTSLKHKTP